MIIRRRQKDENAQNGHGAVCFAAGVFLAAALLAAPCRAAELIVQGIEQTSEGPASTALSEGAAVALGLWLENRGDLNFNYEGSAPPNEAAAPAKERLKAICAERPEAIAAALEAKRESGGAALNVDFLKCGAAGPKSFSLKAKQNGFLGSLEEAAARILKGLSPDEKNFKAPALPGKAAFDDFSKGAFAFRRGDLDAAKRTFEAALQKDPDYRDARLFLGRYFYLDRMMTERAASHFRKALEKAPNDFRLWLYLGLAYEFSDPEKAAEAFEKAKAANPENIQIYLHLGDLYKNELLDLDRAGKNFKALLDRVESNATVWYLLACVQALDGKTDAALASLERAIELEPDFRVTARDDFELNGIKGTAKFGKLTQ